MGQWQRARVVDNIAWTQRLHSLQLESAAIPFKAGQYIRLGLDIDGTLVARPYSFVNPPAEPLLEFHFNVVDQGPLSGRLAVLKPGDQLSIATAPTGFMVLDEVPQADHLWLLATGTAIGPFISILLDAEVWQRFDQIVLVHAVRTEQQLCYRPLLDRLAADHRHQFRWLPFVSREDVEGALRGRIPAAIADGRLQQYIQLPISAELSQVMICGNPEMVSDTMAVLKSLGLQKNLRRQPGHITVERYW